MKVIEKICILCFFTLTIFACGPKESLDVSSGSSGGASGSAAGSLSSSGAATAEAVVEALPSGEGATVRVNLSDDGKRFISYQRDTPYVSLDGKTYVKDDLSPTWQHIADTLNITVEDTNPHNGSKVEATLDLEVSTQLQSAEIFGGAALQFAEYGQNGLFLPLNQYAEYLPNLMSFLSKNPIVEASLTSGDGNIYYSPYFDGIDGIEKTLIIRHDLVEKLLDTNQTWSTDTTLTTYYEPFYPNAYNATIQGTTKSITRSQGTTKNIITQMNNAPRLDGKTAVQLLRNYIDTVYMSSGQYEKRSELFLSENAAYNPDELIALMRAAKLNEEILIGEGQTLHIYFPRENNEMRWRAFLWGVSIWGVQGGDSRHNLAYFATDGTVKDSRGEPDLYAALERFNDLYKEGLVLKDFNNGMGESMSNYRTELFRSEGTKVPNGFITFDYITSTINAVKPDHTGYSDVVFSTILPPAIDWFDTGEYIHFSESSRSVKRFGMGVAAHVADNPDVLAATLKVVDYPFSEEGKVVTVFGPESFWNFDTTGVEGKDYYLFQGEKWPAIKQEVLDEMALLANGNFSVYYREYLGATLPIGFIKSQALEYQTQNEMASSAQKLLDNAIAEGGLIMAGLGGGDVPDYMNVVPTIFPTTRAENNQIASLGSYGQMFSETYYRIVADGSYGEYDSQESFLAAIKSSGFDAYIDFTNAAWDRIKK